MKVEVKGLESWQRVLKGSEEWHVRVTSAAAAFLFEYRATERPRTADPEL